MSGNSISGSCMCSVRLGEGMTKNRTILQSQGPTPCFPSIFLRFAFWPLEFEGGALLEWAEDCIFPDLLDNL